MAYFAVQVVSGRELITKNAIEFAARNQKRTDIKEIIVPSQIVLDLTEVKSKVKTVTPFVSYVFLNIESDEGAYHEMSGDLFRFLNSIPNVCKVLTQSIAKFEIDEMLNSWQNHDLTLLVFQIYHEPAELQKENDSVLTKMKEKIAVNKVISSYKQFVRNITNRGNCPFSAPNYEQTERGLVVTTPITLVMDALNRVSMTIEEFMKAPHKFLKHLTEVGHAAYNQS